jgi:hypothetical protein
MMRFVKLSHSLGLVLLLVMMLHKKMTVGRRRAKATEKIIIRIRLYVILCTIRTVLCSYECGLYDIILCTVYLQYRYSVTRYEYFGFLCISCTGKTELLREVQLRGTVMDIAHFYLSTSSAF